MMPKWCRKPIKAALLAVFSANINSTTTTKLMCVSTDWALRLQSPLVKSYCSPQAFSLTTANSAISFTVPPSALQFHHQYPLQSTASHHQLTPCHWSATNSFYFTNLSRQAVVSRKAKKKQHASAFSGLRGHCSELFTWMEALKL